MMPSGKVVLLMVVILIYSGLSTSIIIANEKNHLLVCIQTKDLLKCHIENFSNKTIICTALVGTYYKEVVVRPRSISRLGIFKKMPIIKYCEVR